MALAVSEPIVGGHTLAVQAQAAKYLVVMHPIALKEAGIIRTLTDAVLEGIVGYYWRYGGIYGVDPALAFSQACEETGYFTFPGRVPVSAHNPAGIGAINASTAYHTYGSWWEGIEAHFLHLLAWANDPRGRRDSRYTLVAYSASKLGWARTWADLAGRWAVPGTGYAAAIEAHFQAILAVKVAQPPPVPPKEAPMTASFPTTDYTRFISNYGYPPNRENRNGHQVVAIVIHRMDGTMGSTLNWFENAASEASSGWGIGLDGGRARYVDRGKSPWTNGDIQKPDLTIPWLKWCIDNGVNPNEVVVTLELEGKGGAPFPEAQYLSTLQTVKEEMAAFGIKAMAQTIVGHYRLNSVTRAGCPGGNFPWVRLFKDLAAPVYAGLSAHLWAAYRDEVAEGDQKYFGNILYEATADLSQYNLARTAQCLVMEKAVWWTDGTTIDQFHRGQYEGLVAAGKVHEWR